MLETFKIVPPGGVRIVNISLSGHYSAPKGGIYFPDTSLNNESPMTRYGQSKLANVLHSKTLNRLYGPWSTNSKAEKLAASLEHWTAEEMKTERCIE
jgi:NAD(P)-dependent dehydrogenase (short-subunit alcohol dehydrogenase family)